MQQIGVWVRSTLSVGSVGSVGRVGGWRFFLANMAFVLVLPSVAAAELVTLVSDARFVDVGMNVQPFSYWSASPTTDFAPFDANLPGSSSYFGSAGQSSIVSTTGMSGSGFSNIDGGIDFSGEFPEVVWFEMGSSTFSVQFDAVAAAPYRFETSTSGYYSLFDQTSSTSLVDLSFSTTNGAVSGTLIPGHRYSMYAYSDGFITLWNNNLPSGAFDFALDFFDPSGAVAFGPAGGQTSLLGGAAAAGGLDITLGASTGQGVLSAAYQAATLAELEGLYGVSPFALPGSGPTSVWTIEGGDDFTGLATLTFGYDTALLPTGYDESLLAVGHYIDGVGWEMLTGVIDENANTITVQTNSFSPFSLVAVPEPGTAMLVMTGLLLAGRGRKRVA